MTIAAAKRFQLSLLGNDGFWEELRDFCNPEARLELISEWAGAFSAEEFEEAHQNLLVECQLEERAEQLGYVKLFWQSLCR